MKKKFCLVQSDKWIAGVCSGIARYFDCDTLLVRIIALVGMLCGCGCTAIAYLIFWMFAPKEETGNEA